MFNIFLRFVICVLIQFCKITWLVHLGLINAVLLFHCEIQGAFSAYKYVFLIAKFSELSLYTGSSCCQCETYLMSLYVTLRPSCKDAQIAFKAAQCALSIQTPYYGEQLVSAAH